MTCEYICLISVHEGELKSLYVDVIPIVDDFFDQWVAVTATPVEEIRKRTMLNNKTSFGHIHRRYLGQTCNFSADPSNVHVHMCLRVLQAFSG